MKAGMRVIAVVPARGGSKTVPGKNIKLLSGKPLLQWSIEIGKSVAEIDRVIVSTDDEQIAEVARNCGAEVYRRPAHLATDEALVIDALRDLIQTLRQAGENDGIMVLLEPTCPLRSTEDVAACLQLLGEGYDSAATFTEAALNPHRAWKIDARKPEVFIPGAIPWLPRQKLPRAYQLNGAVYAFKTSLLEANGNSLLVGKAGAVVMPSDRSVDIDDALDFTVVETLMQGHTDV